MNTMHKSVGNLVFNVLSPFDSYETKHDNGLLVTPQLLSDVTVNKARTVIESMNLGFDFPESFTI